MTYNCVMCVERQSLRIAYGQLAQLDRRTMGYWRPRFMPFLIGCFLVAISATPHSPHEPQTVRIRDSLSKVSKAGISLSDRRKISSSVYLPRNSDVPFSETATSRKYFGRQSPATVYRGVAKRLACSQLLTRLCLRIQRATFVRSDSSRNTLLSLSVCPMQRVDPFDRNFVGPRRLRPYPRLLSTLKL